MKKAWPGYAVSAEVMSDTSNDWGVILTAQLSPSQGTPTVHCGRPVHVVVSKPMLEMLVRLAADLHVVDHVVFPDEGDLTAV